jgi:predicted PhzF superfamily epimerase YddE/YHI9
MKRRFITVDVFTDRRFGGNPLAVVLDAQEPCDRQRPCRARRPACEPAPEHDLTLQLGIAQGIEMGRPSLLEAAAEKRAGEVTTMWVGGKCLPVMRATLEV